MKLLKLFIISVLCLSFFACTDSEKEDNKTDKQVQSQYGWKTTDKEIQGLAPETTLIYESPISGDHYFYAKDKDNVYYNYMKIEGADPETFQIFIKGFETVTRDKNYVYYNGQPIKDSDPTVLEILDYGYFIDAKNVYHEGELLVDADPETFRAVQYSDFGKDDKNVYLGSQLIPEIDAKTFKIYEWSYAGDADAIFYFHYGYKPVIKFLDGVDVDSFEELTRIYNEGTYIDGFAKDKNNVYYHSQKVEGADPEILSTTFQLLSQNYFKDGLNVYFLGQTYSDDENETIPRKIEGADPNTFEEIDYGYYKDINFIYYNGVKIPNINSGSIEDFEINGWQNTYSVGTHLLLLGESYPLDSVEILHQGREYGCGGFSVLKTDADLYFWGEEQIKLKNANPDKFYFFEPPSYFFDGNESIYILRIGRKGCMSFVKELDHIKDPTKLKILSKNYYIYDEGVYMNDRYITTNSLYEKYISEDGLIKAADASTFGVLNDNYAKDKHNVYDHQGMILRDSDPETAWVYDECPRYLLDKNHVYGILREDLDPEKFDVETCT